MELEIFKQAENDQWTFQSVGVFDGFKSLTVTLNYYTYSTFELVVGLTPANIKYFIPETCIYMEGLYFYVDYAVVSDAATAELKVTGKSLLGKSLIRIVARNYAKNARPEQIVTDHLNNELVKPSDAKRQIKYLKLAETPNLGLGSTDYQNSYGIVAEEIETLCTSYDFGVREVATQLGNPGNTLTIYKGEDKSKIIEFSDDFENITKAGYQNNNFDESSTAYVYGEGEGAARKSVKVGDDKTGLDRKELYVDARDLQQKGSESGDMTDSQYTNALKTRGTQKLAERKRVLTLTGETPVSSKLFKLGEDYWLGDVVTIKSELFNLRKESTITSIKKTYDHTGLYIEPIFGKETPTVYDILGR